MLRQGFPGFIEGLNAVWRMFGFVMTQYAIAIANVLYKLDGACCSVRNVLRWLGVTIV